MFNQGSQNRFDYRSYFYASWQKARTGEVLTPLETQIVEVIAHHPEYHFIFENERFKDRDYFPELGEVNPFLHLSLHLGLLEQLTTQRPAGIEKIYKTLLACHKDPHAVAHRMMEKISEMLYQASKGQLTLDDASYLLELEKLTV